MNKGEMGFGPPKRFLVTLENVKTGKRRTVTWTKKRLDGFKSDAQRIVKTVGI
jgi:hypothetical protein